MKELKENDKIYFIVDGEVHQYIVQATFLNHTTRWNDGIFDALKLEKEEKLALASEHYGYKVYQGDWPDYKPGDYAAATRLVKALYDLCNIHNSKLKEHEEIPF